LGGIAVAFSGSLGGYDIAAVTAPGYPSSEDPVVPPGWIPRCWVTTAARLLTNRRAAADEEDPR
jgi:hypothetical protein